MSKILVTAATGKTGKEVLNQLLEKDIDAAGACRHPDRIKKIHGETADARFLDIEKQQDFSEVLKDIDKLYLAISSGVSDMEKHGKRFIDAALDSGVKKIVLLSSFRMDSDKPLALGQIEKYLIDNNVDYTALKPNWFMQNLLTIYYDMIMKDDAIKLPTGDGKCAFIDTRDIAAVGIEALLNDGHKGMDYQLTGPESMDYYEVADILSDAAGRKIEYKALSEEEYKEMLRGLGFPESSLDGIANLYRTVKENKADTVTNEVQNVLGREPISMKQFAEDYADKFKK